MAWIYLIAAGILETLWAVAMKASNGFTLLIPSLITALAMIGSVALLALAMRTLPLGTAYVASGRGSALSVRLRRASLCSANHSHSCG